MYAIRSYYGFVSKLFFWIFVSNYFKMNTSKSTIYSNRIEKFSDLLSNTNKQHSIISWLRLIIFCATIISWFYVITIHIITGIALGISGIIGFVIFLKKHKKLEDLKTYLETILTVNNNEYLCCKGTFDQFDGGSYNFV